MGSCGCRVEGIGEHFIPSLSAPTPTQQLAYSNTNLRGWIPDFITNLPGVIEHGVEDWNVRGVRKEGECCDRYVDYISKRNDDILFSNENTMCKPGLNCVSGAPAAPNTESYNSCPRLHANQDYHGRCNFAMDPLDIDAAQNKLGARKRACKHKNTNSDGSKMFDSVDYNFCTKMGYSWGS